MQAVQNAGRRLSRPIGAVLARAGVSPDLLTALGLVGNGVAGALLGWGYLFWGGCVVLVASALDMLDGAVARAGGSATRRGAFLDSVFDRMSEVAAFAGLLAYSLVRGKTQEVALIFAAAVGSILVSYMRARAEGLGIQCKDGVAPREVRVVILAVGLLAGQLKVALWVLAIVSNLTALHRLVVVARRAGAVKP